MSLFEPKKTCYYDAMKKPKSFKKKQSKTKKFISKKSTRYVRQSLYQTKQWNNLRYSFISKNPKCFTCSRPSSVVDHIVAHKGKLDLFWDEQNYMPLCSACHNYITGKFDQYNPQKLEEKMKWVKAMREKNNLNFGIKVVRIDSDGNKL